MKKIREIQKAIEELSYEERQKLRKWFIGRDLNKMSKQIPDWFDKVHESIGRWIASLMDKRTGMLKDCSDSEIPFSIPATSHGFAIFEDGLGKSRFELPNYDANKEKQIIEYVRNAQDEKTGLVIEPQLDSRFSQPDNEREYRNFRVAVTRYAEGLLKRLGSALKYPFTEAGGTEKPNPQKALEYIRTGDWDRPWGIGSHAGGIVREFFFLINDGHEEYIPATCEMIEFILSKQNPQTGMWGRTGIPLYEQISGTLKVLGRFYFQLGMDIPYLDKLADSCIEFHKDKSFYGESDDMCIPRNVMEMCVLCLDASDYRKDELEDTLISLLEHIYEYHYKPDGAFSSYHSGTKPIQWCGAKICGESKVPRSNINGTAGACHSFNMIGGYFGWSGKVPFPCKTYQSNWRERIEKFRYKIVRTNKGTIEIIRK